VEVNWILQPQKQMALPKEGSCQQKYVNSMGGARAPTLVPEKVKQQRQGGAGANPPAQQTGGRVGDTHGDAGIGPLGGPTRARDLDDARHLDDLWSRDPPSIAVRIGNQDDAGAPRAGNPDDTRGDKVRQRAVACVTRCVVCQVCQPHGCNKDTTLDTHLCGAHRREPHYNMTGARAYMLLYCACIYSMCTHWHIEWKERDTGN
jgi:hypothetical protein